MVLEGQGLPGLHLFSSLRDVQPPQTVGPASTISSQPMLCGETIGADRFPEGPGVSTRMTSEPQKTLTTKGSGEAKTTSWSIVACLHLAPKKEPDSESEELGILCLEASASNYVRWSPSGGHRYWVGGHRQWVGGHPY